MEEALLTRRKQTQRRQGIQARRALRDAERASMSAALCAHLAALPAWQEARTVLAYAAAGGEADLSPLLEAAAGKRIAYPVCLDEARMIAALPAAEKGWETGRYGIRAPVLERAEILPPEQLDLVLVPCTAFDPDCFRVGMGKGYYDRYLPGCIRAQAVGIAFEVQKVEKAAAGLFDRRLDGFVTERGIYQWQR